MQADEVGSEDGDLHLHLIVRAGASRVALPMTALRSVVTAPPVTRLPAGRSLAGLVALAGEPVAVVDLATLLGTEKASAEPDQFLVVVDDGDSKLAIRVDGVEGHETLLPHLSDRIDLSDSAGDAVTPLATPIGRDGLIVLDLNAALADPRLTLSDPGRSPELEGLDR